jgi:hypothetical protein
LASNKVIASLPCSEDHPAFNTALILGVFAGIVILHLNYFHSKGPLIPEGYYII